MDAMQSMQIEMKKMKRKNSEKKYQMAKKEQENTPNERKKWQQQQDTRKIDTFTIIDIWFLQLFDQKMSKENHF